MTKHFSPPVLPALLLFLVQSLTPCHAQNNLEQDLQQVVKPVQDLYEKTGYSINFNPETHYANYVQYCYDEIAASKPKLGGCKHFLRDWEIAAALKEADYPPFEDCGYQKGHLKPLKHSTASVQECMDGNRYSNIVPQTQQLNNGIWYALEDTIRKRALDGKQIEVWTGPIPIWLDTLSTGALVPVGFWKILRTVKDGQNDIIECYALPQRPEQKLKLEHYKISYFDLKELILLDPLHSMPGFSEEPLRSWDKLKGKDWPLDLYQSMDTLLSNRQFLEAYLTAARRDQSLNIYHYGDSHGQHQTIFRWVVLKTWGEAHRQMINLGSSLLANSQRDLTILESIKESCAALKLTECITPIERRISELENKFSASIECESVEHNQYLYSVVKIGEHCWFAENLRTFQFANGDKIQDEDYNSWNHPAYPALCKVELTFPVKRNKSDSKDSVKRYEVFYNWRAIEDERGLCPAGWRVPSVYDWLDLIQTADAWTKAKNLYTSEKLFRQFNGKDKVGFDAKPFGSIGAQFSFGSEDYYYRKRAIKSGEGAVFWSMEPPTGVLLCEEKEVHYQITPNDPSSTALSVRCIKDGGLPQ